MSTDVDARPTPRAPRFGVLLLLLALLAFAMREAYVLSAIVDGPIRGDIREYVAAAWNLVAHGTFSTTLPPGVPVPDSFRLPGYPWLIALGMTLFPQDPDWVRLGGWYPFVLQAQVVLGTLSVVLVALLARHWLRPTWAIFAGLVLALWPHHIAATNTLLSEVLFGFMLVAALYCFARAWTTGRIGWYALAGATFGYAWLVNPVVLLFPPCLAALTWWHGSRRPAAVMLALFLVPVLGMTIRNAGLDTEARGSAGRASINFVQGSWPNYHPAANAVSKGDPVAIAIIQEIDAENAALVADPMAGLKRMRARMAEDPAWYAEWYASKPWVLWGWKIRLGASDIHYHVVRNSLLERNAVLRSIVAIYRWCTPALTTITLAAGLVLMLIGLRRRSWVPAAAVGALAIYLTLVHVVLQAEPRYATAYRGLEAVLVATALAWLVAKARDAKLIRRMSAIRVTRRVTL